MRSQIAEFMHGTALNWKIRPQTGYRVLEPRCAVDDRQLRLLQPACDQAVEQRAPCRLTLPTHVANSQQYLLSIAAYAKYYQHRYHRRLSVKAYAHNRPIEDQSHDIFRRQITRIPSFPVRLDLAPGPAHRVLADAATAEDRCQRTTDAARVGARKIAGRDQSFDLLRPSPVCRKRLALPFDGRAIPALKPSPRNRNRHLAKRAHHLAFASPVAMARDARRGHRSFIAKPLRDIHSHSRVGPPPRVTRAAERIAPFFLEDLLDKAANATAPQRPDAVAPAFTS